MLRRIIACFEFLILFTVQTGSFAYQIALCLAVSDYLPVKNL